MLWHSGIETLSFREALSINLKQLDSVSFEGAEGAKLWDDRRYMTAKDGEKWQRTYIQPGMYSKILESYLERFDPGQIMFYRLEKLKTDFDSQMKSIFSFLDVDDSYIIQKKQEKNFNYNRSVL